MNTDKFKKFFNRVNYADMFVVSLIIAIIINIMQFNGIERQTNDINFRVLHNLHKLDLQPSNIIEVAFSTVSPIRRRYGLSFALGQVSDNANIIVPLGNSMHIEEMFYLGNISGIERLNYDSLKFLDSFDPTPYFVSSNKNRRRDPQYRIAVQNGKDKAKEFILIKWQDDITLLVDTFILPENKIEKLKELRECLPN